MTREDLEALEAKAKAATEGPWFSHDFTMEESREKYIETRLNMADTASMVQRGEGIRAPSDAYSITTVVSRQ